MNKVITGYATPADIKINLAESLLGSTRSIYAKKRAKLHPFFTLASTSISVSVLRVICLIGGFGCTHDFGENSDEDHADSRETYADDAHVDLDVGPVYNFDLVPGWI